MRCGLGLFSSRGWRTAGCGVVFLICKMCLAQDSGGVLPDAPSATLAASSSVIPPDEVQPKRVLGVLPNFRSVSPGQVVAKPTTREKFITATEDNFDYSALLFGGTIALESFVAKQTPEFHQGMAGYGRYYWHTVADQSIENYFVEFIIPAVNHEDSRYYAMGREGGGIWKRAGYSLSRAVVTRSDSGQPMFNYAEIGGAAAAVSISQFYYPTQERTLSNGVRNWGLDVGYDSLTFMFHEFWLDISSALLGKKSGNAAATR
jgi:hypothetical protein